MKIKRAPFLPPKPNPIFLFLLQWLWPFILKGKKVRLSVDISSDDLYKLKKVLNHRLLLLPNHPSDVEPHVMFDIARKLGTNFYGVAAREVFDWKAGLQGLLFQAMGAYSLIRGTADRDSFRTTKEILVRGENPLVIFIEGEVSNENDTLIPFEPGVIQLAFWGLEELLKQDKGSNEPIYLAPIAIKYFYHQGSERAIDKSIKRLADALDIEDSPINCNEERYQKVKAIAEAILEFEEKKHRLESNNKSLTERVEIIREKILNKLEIFLELPETKISFLDRIRRVRNTMDKLTYRYQDVSDLSDYEQNMCARLDRMFKGFYLELERLQNFLVIREGYIPERPEAERFIEVLRRFEREVFCKDKLTHPKTAKVQVGTIINLRDYYEQYKENKKDTLQSIAKQFEEEINDLVIKAERPKV